MKKFDASGNSLVIAVKAGIQRADRKLSNGIPAFVGMTSNP